MTREEFSILVKGMKATYTEPKFIPDKDAFNIWYGLLSDLSYETANAAIQSYMLSEAKPPTIADIRKAAAKVVSPELPSSGEAWQKVIKAVRRFGYYQQREALDSLDQLTREAAERFGFRELCDINASDNGVARGQFMRIYEQIANRKKADAVLPLGMHEEIARLRAEAVARIEEKA